jgi:hypothetical protein
VSSSAKADDPVIIERTTSVCDYWVPRLRGA